jgi:hypothetical protein
MDPILPRQLDYLAQELTRLESQMIDPVDFGELKGEVSALKARVDNMAGKVDQLLEMANQGKGGLWMFRTAYVAAGGLVVWLAEHFVTKIVK